VSIADLLRVGEAFCQSVRDRSANLFVDPAADTDVALLVDVETDAESEAAIPQTRQCVKLGQ
jgi:hypothetical protein